MYLQNGVFENEKFTSIYCPVKKTKILKAYITAAEAKINKIDTHEVALFIEKFMLMEV